MDTLQEAFKEASLYARKKDIAVRCRRIIKKTPRKFKELIEYARHAETINPPRLIIQGADELLKTITEVETLERILNNGIMGTNREWLISPSKPILNIVNITNKKMATALKALL